MDFKRLSEVTDAVKNGKRSQAPVIGRVVSDNVNPLDKLNVDKVRSKRKVVILDKAFISKLRKLPRSDRREFLSKISDSERKKVLKMLKVSDNSADLNYITLDTLLSNYIYDPSNLNLTNLQDFTESGMVEWSDDIKDLIQAVIDGTQVPEAGLDELLSHLEGYVSRLAALLDAHDESDDLDDEGDDEDEITFSDEELEEMSDSVHSLVNDILNNKKPLSLLKDSVDSLLDEFKGKSRKYAMKSKKYWELIDEAWDEQYEKKNKEISDSLNLLETIVDDNALDEVYDKPLVDKDGVVEDVEDASVAELLINALQSYSEGDSEKLDELFKQSIEVPTDEASEDEMDNDSDEDLPEDEEVPVETEEEVSDAVNSLLQRLKKGKSVNKLVDSLAKKYPSLEKYNLKVNDCETICPYEVETADVVADIPLTCEEFNACNQGIPPVVMCMLEQENPIVWPFSEWNVDNDCINCQGRLYKPYTCGVEEVERRLEEAQDDPTRVEIIGSTSVPLTTFRKVAAKCDALNLIDPRFYRPSAFSKSWKFKGNVSELLGDSVKGTTFTRSSSPEGTISIFGATYSVI